MLRGVSRPVSFNAGTMSHGSLLAVMACQPMTSSTVFGSFGEHRKQPFTRTLQCGLSPKNGEVGVSISSLIR